MTSPFRLLVGLGNPGDKYHKQRHNVGHWLADALAARQQLGFRHNATLGCWLSDPNPQGVRIARLDCFMNHSGLGAAKICRYFSIAPEALIVAHDELDLPPGTARLKRGGGHGGHNGLRSLIAHLGTDFARLRFGIGHPGSREQVHGYVLSAPGKTDHELIHQAIDNALACMPLWLGDDWDRAQQQLHSQA